MHLLKIMHEVKVYVHEFNMEVVIISDFPIPECKISLSDGNWTGIKFRG